MKARIEVDEHDGRGWKPTRWGYDDDESKLRRGLFVTYGLAKSKIKEVRKEYPHCSYRLVREKKRTHKNTRRLTARERAAYLKRSYMLATDVMHAIERALQLHAAAAIKRAKR